MGFEIEASHHEVAAGQHEIDFKYADALTAADNIMTFKLAVKTLAQKNGLHATFMPKPVFGINGSGMHTNMSLFRDGKNAFFDPSDKLGLSVEWSYTGSAVAGDEPYLLHGSYAKYDSLTVSGPVNDLDIWVLRYLAGNNGYERGGGSPTDGKLRYLNLYNADIKKDDNCKAHYLNMGEYISIEWWDIEKDNEVGKFFFKGCGALEKVVLPKSVTTIVTAIFEGCTSLKSVAITGATTEYDGSKYWHYNMLEYPLEELVFLTDGHATSTAKNPWGQQIGTVFTTQDKLSTYINDPRVISQTENVIAPFKDDAVWKHLAENGHFFPSEFLELEDVGTMFSEFSQELKDLHTFDEFRNFAKVKKLQGTFRGTTGLVSVTLPPSVAVCRPHQS